MDVTQRNEVESGEQLDFGELFARLTRRWYVVLIALLVAIAIAIIYLNIVTYRYTATMKIAPTQAGQQNGLGSKLGRLNSLASVAGVNLSTGSGSIDFDLYVEGVQSRDVADLLVRDGELMHRLYFREWDASHRLWRAPSGGLAGAAHGLKSSLGLPDYPYRPPDGARLLLLLQKDIIVDRSLRTPIVTVTYDNESPETAVLLLRRVDATVDGLLRHRALVRSNEAIAFLQNNLRTVQLAEQRTAIADLLASQMQIRMSATSSQPFAAEVFEQPAASFRPTSPLLVRTLALAVLGGLIAGITLALSRGPTGRHVAREKPYRVGR